MAKIACIGEVMIELASSPVLYRGEAKLKALAYAGDTYNTVVSLSRLGVPATYITRLGDDPYSDAILDSLHEEGVDVQSVICQQGMVPGLYMIHNSDDGEREFFYWRTQAPARQLFHHHDEISRWEKELADTEWIYLSGITLAIIGETGRQNLQTFIQRFRQRGGKLAFDSNYRPQLWENAQEAQAAMHEFLSLTDLALLTLEDETLLWGKSITGLADARKHYEAYAIAEIVLKRGPEDVLILQDGKEITVPVMPVKNIVDTTAAGDNFNAGYLAQRLNGDSPEAAALQGNRCAAIVIQHRGGVIEREVFLAAL